MKKRRASDGFGSGPKVIVTIENSRMFWVFFNLLYNIQGNP